MKVWSYSIACMVFLCRTLSAAGFRKVELRGTAAENSWVEQRGGTFFTFGGLGYTSFTEFSCVDGTTGLGANPCPSTKLRIYQASDAQLAGMIDTKYNGAYRVLNPGPGLLAVVPNTLVVSTFTVQSDASNTITLSLSAAQSVVSRTGSGVCSIDQPSTSFIYYVEVETTPTTATKFRKIDINTVNN